MESPLCTIQKKERINFLTEQYVFQSCLLTAQDNSKIKFDILKLSSISPLIRSILTSFSVPVFLLDTVDIILPDVSVEELKTLHHLTSVRSSEEDGLCLSMDNWHKLQSLLDTLDSNEEKNNEPGQTILPSWRTQQILLKTGTKTPSVSLMLSIPMI